MAHYNDGEFHKPAESRQRILFKGLQYGNGNLYPTDVDGLYDAKGKGWIYYEVKRVGVELPDGQKILIRRFNEDMTKAGKYCIAILAEHNVEAPNDIYIVGLPVRQIKISTNEWRTPNRPITVKEITDIVADRLMKGKTKKISK